MEIPPGVDDLKLRVDGQSRKEYACGCYQRLHERQVVWSFFPVCPPHKAAVREEWNNRPWHKKLFGYAMFVWLAALAAAGLGVVSFVLWKIIGSFF